MSGRSEAHPVVSRDLQHWQHRYGAILTDVKNGLAALGEGIDDFERTHSVDALAAAVATFDQVLQRAETLPPIPDRTAAGLYARAIAAWRRSGPLLVDGARAVDTDRVARSQRQMADAADDWGSLGRRLESLNDLHRDRPTAPTGSASATTIQLAGPAQHRSIRLWYDQNRAILPGFLFALGFGLAGVIAVVVSLSTQDNTPIAFVVVVLAICVPLLVIAVWGAVRSGWLGGRAARARRADELIIDDAGVRRTNPVARFDVPWWSVSQVQVLTAETFRGETSRWKIVVRRTGSSVALGFVPEDADSFRTAHPGLTAGPLHDGFPGLEGQAGCRLGVMTVRAQRTLEAALREHADGRFAGTIDSRRTVRRR